MLIYSLAHYPMYELKKHPLRNNNGDAESDAGEHILLNLGAIPKPCEKLGVQSVDPKTGGLSRYAHGQGMGPRLPAAPSI